jgi:hypothetical protein
MSTPPSPTVRTPRTAPKKPKKSSTWSECKKLVHDCLTENDGQTYCPFRVSGLFLNLMGFPTFIGCSLYSVFRDHHFDMIAFGTAFGAMLSGCAVLAGGVAMKARTDNPLQEQQQ